MKQTDYVGSSQRVEGPEEVQLLSHQQKLKGGLLSGRPSGLKYSWVIGDQALS